MARQTEEHPRPERGAWGFNRGGCGTTKHARDAAARYYHFYEREWDSYDELLEWFEWEVPERFNSAAYCCDRWAETRPEAVAIRYEDDAGASKNITYATLDERARRLAGFLRERGVSTGDRVGVNCPQRPETVVSHLAC